MGTDNIEFTLGLQDGTYGAEAITVANGWTLAYGTAMTQYNGHSRYENAVSGNMYKPFARNIQSGGFTVTMNMEQFANLDTSYVGFYIGLSDGKYYIVDGISTNQGRTYKTGWNKVTERPTTIGLQSHPTLISLNATNHTGGTLTSYVMTFNSDGTWSGAGTWNDDTPLKIVEVGFIISTIGGANDFAHIHDIQVEADAVTTEGGSADTTTAKTKQISATSEVGGGGGALWTVDNTDGNLDPEYNLRKSLDVYNPYGHVMFRGEVKGYTVKDNIIEYELEEASRKLADLFAGIDPVSFWSDIKRCDDNAIYEPFANWVFNDFNGKMVMFSDNNLYKATIYPISIDGEKQSKSTGLWDGAMTNEIGNKNRIYYYDPNGVSPVKIIDTSVETVTFNNNSPSADTIVLASSSWSNFSIAVGDRLQVIGSAVNDAETNFPYVTVSATSGGTLTVTLGTDALLNETMTSGNVQFGVFRDVFAIHYEQVVSQFPKIRSICNFKTWDKDDVVWDKLTLRLVHRQTSLKGTKVEGVDEVNFAAIYIYNYSLAQYDVLKQFTKDNHSDDNVGDEEWYEPAIEAADNSAGRSPIFDDKLDVLEELGISKELFKSTYYGNTSGANANGFKSSNIKIAVYSNEVVGITADPKMEIHYIHLEFEENESDLSTTQGQSILSALISSNTINVLNLDDTVSWAETDHPQADGVTKDDEYWITDDIETVLTNIFANLTNFTLVLQLNGDYTEYGEIADLQYTEIYDVLQKYSSQHNWVWWYEVVNEVGTVYIADNFIDSGVTITSSDILNYTNGGLQFTEDTKNIRDKISVFGANDIQKHLVAGTDYTISNAHTLGEEHIVYRDKELYTQRNVDEYATSVVNRHDRPSITMSFTLDLDYAIYVAIRKGKLITIELDEYSTSARSGEPNSGKLFIRGFSLHRIEGTGWVNYLTVYLQNRVI